MRPASVVLRRAAARWFAGGLSAVGMCKTRTQPAHEDFPLDWNAPEPTDRDARAVFIASRQRLDNPLLLDQLPYQQIPN